MMMFVLISVNFDDQISVPIKVNANIYHIGRLGFITAVHACLSLPPPTPGSAWELEMGLSWNFAAVHTRICCKIISVVSCGLLGFYWRLTAICLAGLAMN